MSVLWTALAVAVAEAEVEVEKLADEEQAPMGEKVADAALWEVVEAWLLGRIGLNLANLTKQTRTRTRTGPGPEAVPEAYPITNPNSNPNLT